MRSTFFLLLLLFRACLEFVCLLNLRLSVWDEISFLICKIVKSNVNDIDMELYFIFIEKENTIMDEKWILVDRK